MELENWFKKECHFAGIQIRQNHFALMAFNRFLSQQGFERIIELGTGWGGFALFLSLYQQVWNRELYSFDIEESPFPNVNEILDKNSHFIRGDIFLLKDFINDLITKPGRVLVLCDNGEKIREFNEFSKSLKTQDVIMCHDFYESRADFENDLNRTWDWCEITLPDIQDSINSYNLCQICSEYFGLAHWGCFIRTETDNKEIN